jgi:hypothetical protein
VEVEPDDLYSDIANKRFLLGDTPGKALETPGETEGLQKGAVFGTKVAHHEFNKCHPYFSER